MGWIWSGIFGPTTKQSRFGQALDQLSPKNTVSIYALSFFFFFLRYMVFFYCLFQFMGIGSSFRFGEVSGYGFGERGEIMWMVVLVVVIYQFGRSTITKYLRICKI